MASAEATFRRRANVADDLQSILAPTPPVEQPKYGYPVYQGPYKNSNVDLQFWVPGYGWYAGLSTTTNSSGCYSFPQLSHGNLSSYYVRVVARSTNSNYSVDGVSSMAGPGRGTVNLGTATVYG